MTEDEAFEEARKHAKAKLDFYMHVAVYVTVIVMLLGINLLSWSGTYWVIWPALFWGVAVVFHGASAFFVSGKDGLIDRMARRELEKHPGGGENCA